MSQSVPDRCCLNCHFLVGIPASGYRFSATKLAREALRKMITNSATLNEMDNIHIDANYTCDQGIWVTIKISDFCELNKNRRKSCPFLPYKEGLHDLSKAKELERTETSRRRQKRNLILTLLALGIAIVALTVAILKLLVSLGWIGNR